MAKASATSRRSRRPARIRVGLGSWADAEYVGILYQKGSPPGERLKAYATWFDHVEVNASYYRIPPRTLVARWVAQTPAAFRFDVKLHQSFSRAPERTGRDKAFVNRWLEAMAPLVDAGKLGAFLLVLPPGFGPERHRLEELDPLSERLAPNLLAVELRDSRWVSDETAARTFDYYRARKLVWVGVDMPRIQGSTIMPPVDEVTNPRLAYLRLHGRNTKWLTAKSAADRHMYQYPPSELKEMALRVKALAGKTDEVHVVANNHARDFAPKTALALRPLLGLKAR